MRPHFEVIIQRQLDGVGRVHQRWFFQPKPMLDTAHPQQRMPAVRCVPDLSVRKSVQIERHGRAEQWRQRLAHGNYRWQSLRRPKDCLLVKGPLGVSCESRCPISSEIQRLHQDRDAQGPSYDGRVENLDYGEDIPRQSR